MYIINTQSHDFSGTIWNKQARTRAILVAFGKMLSCLFTPNCTRNHVITYTKPDMNRIIYQIVNNVNRTEWSPIRIGNHMISSTIWNK